MFYLPQIVFIIFFYILPVSGDHSPNGIVVITESPNRSSRPQEIMVLEHDTISYNHQQEPQSQRQRISCKTSSSYSAANNNYGGAGGGNGGGGGPSWHGKCPHCYHEYANISSLKYHVRLVHSEANNTICCYLCPQNFSSKLILREHLYTCHNVKYQWISTIWYWIVLYFSKM